MTGMATNFNKAPKGEEMSGPRGCDRKEEKEPAPMTVDWGGRGEKIVSSAVASQGMKDKGDTEEVKEEEEEEEEAFLEMLNRAAAIEEAVVKAITKAEERHRVNKDLFKRRMEAKWMERVEDDKARTGEEV